MSTAAERRAIRDERAREAAQAFAQYTPDPEVQAMIAETLAPLYALRLERQRMESERHALLERSAEAVREADARIKRDRLPINVPVLADALGVVRQTIHAYIRGTYAPDHKKLDEIGAPK
jgi:DNA-binding transcriptional regulator YiaG